MAAYGVYLDRIGKVVGAMRLGRADSAYAAAIKVQIRVNRSDASAPTLIAIAQLVATNIDFSEPGPASYVLTATADAGAAGTLATALRQADAAGVGSTIIIGGVASGLATILYGWSGGGGYGVGFPDVGAASPVAGYSP